MRVNLAVDSVRRTRRSMGAQAGSTLIIVLLALLVLSIVGLSLALITQTEMQIGANERSVQRVFYAAETGLSTSAARALTGADYAGQTLEVVDKGFIPALNIRHEVEVTPFLPILQTACNLCEINNAGHYGSQSYLRVNHAVTAYARRVGGASTDLAEKSTSMMVDVQPWQLTAEALVPLSDPVQLAKVRF